MNSLRILVAESSGFSGQAGALLSTLGTVTLADLDRKGLLAAIPEADVLWIRLRHRIDGPLIEKGSRLRIVVSPTTGLNHIDTETLARRGIELVSLRGETEFLKDVRATAEHTIGLILACLRRIPPAVADVCAGRWNRDAFQGAELYGKTVGIIGYGRLGRIVARYLRAFDARIVVADPKLSLGPLDPHIEGASLVEVLRQSDLVTLHVDLRPETEGFFTRAMFDRMKPGSYFVNTARGELIDEAALLENLRSGHITAAALDVLCNEQAAGMATHPLVEYAREHDNLLITPHIGGCTTESMRKTELFLAQKLLRVVNDRRFAEAATPTY